MKWLEGWFGTASGALGLLALVIMSVLAPVQQHTYSVAYSGSCVSSSDGPTICSNSPAAPGPDTGLLILFGVIALLFIGVLVGTWLDLRGARRFGRILLLTSATFLLVVMTTNGAILNLGGAQIITQIYLYILLAFATGILACARRDAPRPTATPGA